MHNARQAIHASTERRSMSRRNVLIAVAVVVVATGWYLFRYGTPPVGSDYLVIGHESLGEVVDVGPAVSRLRPGDLVVTMVRRPCPHHHCVPCGAGRQDFCNTGDFRELGIKEAHGFMTEYVVEDERFMHPVPQAYRDVMVLLEPLTIAEKALAQLWQVQQRLPWACAVIPGQAPAGCHRAVVLGAGPVGLLGAMALPAAGFETYVYSREPADSPKSNIVEAIGATYVSGATSSIEDLAKQVGRIDVVYEAAGASAVCFEMMQFLGTNGNRYFDVGVEYAKATTDDILMRITIKNHAPEPADLHLIPTLWFRNTWSWDVDSSRPVLRPGQPRRDSVVIEAEHDTLGRRWLYCQGSPEVLFTENDTNVQRLYGTPNPGPFVKDGINDCIVYGRRDAVNPAQVGTKAAAWYRLSGLFHN